MNTVTATEATFTLTEATPNTMLLNNSAYSLPSASAAIPFGGVTSLIRMVRLVSRGAIIEEIDNYAMLSTILKEVTTDVDELQTRGFVSGDYPHGVDYQTKFANRVQMFSSRGSASGSNSIRRFAFKLDQLGFFRSQHYLPLEWLPVTIELIFHQPAQCMMNAWTVVSAPARGSYTPSFTITEPTFHAQLLQFNSEYTSAVNNKIATDGAVLPIRTWTNTQRFSYGGSSEKFILSNKMKSLTRILCVPRQARVANTYGLGVNQYPSHIIATSANGGRAYVTAERELQNYRWLIGSTPVTDHVIDCTKGGASQAQEMIKFFAGLTGTVNFPRPRIPVVADSTTATAGGNLVPSITHTHFYDNFRTEMGLICQNLSLENIDSDDVFTGQFANTFSDLTLETSWNGGFESGEHLELQFFFEYNALLTITPTALLIEK